MPLLDLADTTDSAGLWGYLPANTSYNVAEWYPGSLQVLVSTQGVGWAKNHVGPWNGYRKNVKEKITTRPLSQMGAGAKMMHSHGGVNLKWSAWNAANPTDDRGQPRPAPSRLEYLYRYCGFEPSTFFHHSPEALNAVHKHQAVIDKKVTVGTKRVFKWSQWPADLGGKPKLISKELGHGNVTIEAHWEVTIDEDVDFLNKVNISGVLKFEDKPGCCKFVARYIFVGPLFGRLEAGTEQAPFTKGYAHIILKGHPLTPQLQSFRPHIRGSAKFLGSKFVAVQGTLSLYGSPRNKTWTKLAASVSNGSSTLILEDASSFKVGDVISIKNGMETPKITAISGNTITLATPLFNSYLGLDHVHMSRAETKGLMATAVGLVDGHTVCVEGEDTPGVPMCDVDENRTCPYSTELPPGMSLHDFAKEMKYYYKKDGRASHPNCRPCLAVSEQHYPGKVFAMPYFHEYVYDCPKDHGVIHVSDVVFKHGSDMVLYHPYSAGERYLEVAWQRRPHVWWRDPVWKELGLEQLEIPAHKVVKSAFNNTHCGTSVNPVYAEYGKLFFGAEPLTQNVFLRGSVTIKGTRTANGIGVRGLIDSSTAGSAEIGYFIFEDNYLAGCELTTWDGDQVKNNMIMASVWLGCGTVQSKDTARFTGNIISSTEQETCIYTYSRRSIKTLSASRHLGISDNVIHSCRMGVIFRQNSVSQDVVARMKFIDNMIGIHYQTTGVDARIHDHSRQEFNVIDTIIYAKADGRGTGMEHPRVAPMPITIPGTIYAFPAWRALTVLRTTLFFQTKLNGVTFVGYKKEMQGKAIPIGTSLAPVAKEGDQYPIMVRNVKFENMDMNAALTHQHSWGAGFGDQECIQIDCDGRRNSLVIDEDGSLLGTPGTIIPQPWKFYDKLTYADPMGFDTMEDLIPMPARYDRFGDAIPFPTGVPHGTGGGLEYKCNRTDGCEVLFHTGWGSDGGENG